MDGGLPQRFRTSRVEEGTPSICEMAWEPLAESPRLRVTVVFPRHTHHSYIVLDVLCSSLGVGFLPRWTKVCDTGTGGRRLCLYPLLKSEPRFNSRESSYYALAKACDGDGDGAESSVPMQIHRMPHPFSADPIVGVFVTIVDDLSETGALAQITYL